MEYSELQQRVLEAKKRTGTVILAHTYQTPDIIDVSDITGDSFFLSKKSAELGAKRVVMCGVRFMAETVKILSPETEVLLPVAFATCPMAEQILPERVRAFRKENPGAAVVAYINTTAALKAECDVCVTSSSAVRIVGKLPQHDVLFLPDKNLGAYVQKELPDKNIILWDGCCPVHNALTAKDVLSFRALHPNALFAVHPEAPAEVLALADCVGATSEIIRYAKEQKGEVIVGTERGVVDYLSTHEVHGERFLQLAPKKMRCENMKATMLTDVLNAIEGRGGVPIVLPEALRLKAKKSIDKMLELG